MRHFQDIQGGTENHLTGSLTQESGVEVITLIKNHHSVNRGHYFKVTPDKY